MMHGKVFEIVEDVHIMAQRKAFARTISISDPTSKGVATVEPKISVLAKAIGNRQVRYTDGSKIR